MKGGTIVNSTNKTPSEAVIRDQLALNLSILEDGLTVVSLEYPLPNMEGSRGYIDILAKDKYGHFVIIELKRSNQAARQAIHELCKYPSLLRQQLGLPAHEIRCILVSTEWHELLRPFSDFARIFDYPADGFEIEINNDGKPISAHKIKFLDKIDDKELPQFIENHLIFLFDTKLRRDNSIPFLRNILDSFDIENYCLLKMTRRNETPFGMYSYVLYFACAALDTGLLNKFYSSDEVLDYLDSPASTNEAILAGVFREFSPHHDSLEIGYPEKLTADLNKWAIDEIIRSGRFSPRRYLPILRSFSG
jgi:hypothetical protein